MAAASKPRCAIRTSSDADPRHHPPRKPAVHAVVASIVPIESGEAIEGPEHGYRDVVPGAEWQQVLAIRVSSRYHFNIDIMEAPLAQLVVRNLDPAVKERLRARTKRLGRSLETEARSILSEAAEDELPVVPEPGLGTRFAAHFRGMGIELDLSTFRGRPLRGVDSDKRS